MAHHLLAVPTLWIHPFKVESDDISIMFRCLGNEDDMPNISLICYEIRNPSGLTEDPNINDVVGFVIADFMKDAISSNSTIVETFDQFDTSPPPFLYLVEGKPEPRLAMHFILPVSGRKISNPEYCWINKSDFTQPFGYYQTSTCKDREMEALERVFALIGKEVRS